MKNRIALICCVVSAAATVFAQGDRGQGRSMVVSRYGIVASEHPLASQAGAMILAQGGNAVDAAVAANAAMGVVSPMMCGMGGDLFAIVYEAKTRQALRPQRQRLVAGGADASRVLKAMGIKEMPQTGIHAVTVPGAVDGWDKLLRRFGRKKLRRGAGPGDPLRGGRVSGQRDFRRAIGPPARACCGRTPTRRRSFCRRPRAAAGRNLPQPGPGRVAGAGSPKHGREASIAGATAKRLVRSQECWAAR